VAATVTTIAARGKNRPFDRAGIRAVDCSEMPQFMHQNRAEIEGRIGYRT
jgi:hypothetical protein